VQRAKKQLKLPVLVPDSWACGVECVVACV
jgi:hypothetical protein